MGNRRWNLDAAPIKTVSENENKIVYNYIMLTITAQKNWDSSVKISSYCMLTKMQISFCISIRRTINSLFAVILFSQRVKSFPVTRRQSQSLSHSVSSLSSRVSRGRYCGVLTPFSLSCLFICHVGNKSNKWRGVTLSLRKGGQGQGHTNPIHHHECNFKFCSFTRI